MEKAKIIFKDGTSISVDLNGSSLITDIKPEFPEDITGVKIQSESYNQTFKHPIINECFSIDGRYWFTINEIPEEVLKERKVQADIQYIAMMADIDLEV